MQGLVLGDLTIEVEETTDSRIVFRWLGASNSRDPDKGLRSFFALALAQAAAQSLTLEMHFEKLKHFNSSTIAALLRFTEESRTRGVRVSLYYDGSLRWQAHNFEAMGSLVRADGLLRIHRISTAPPPEKIGAH